MEENYQTLHDFVLDPSFCDWVLGRDGDAAAYWQTYLKANPDKSKLIEQAKTLVFAMGQNTSSDWAASEKAEVWTQIQSRITGQPESSHDNTEGTVHCLRPAAWRVASRVAASLTALVVLSIALYYLMQRGQGETIRYATQYGEVKSVLLPDGSEVTLNANSSLSFKKPWDAEFTREVTLKGEAFFKVTHQQNDQKFKVKLADTVSIEVLGTQFTATKRPHDTKVVLNEGKVKFSVAKKGLLGFFQETVAQETLSPGEAVALAAHKTGEGMLVKSTVQHPEIYNAFQYNKLMFADAPLTDVARVLEDVYGLKVTFSNRELMSRRYTGSVPLDKVEVLFVALEKLFHLKISQQGNQLDFS
ncbi:FecR family protein [Rufibacter roseolus]|uniref:FecR family protein n=1 Tax=Rufibacter roseolus TaxID=2817375 RepID=UPI001B3088DC|nr:FecR domain-containing protein [Rufibacter roseolus]